MKRIKIEIDDKTYWLIPEKDSKSRRFEMLKLKQKYYLLPEEKIFEILEEQGILHQETKGVLLSGS